MEMDLRKQSIKTVDLKTIWRSEPRQLLKFNVC